MKKHVGLILLIVLFSNSVFTQSIVNIDIQKNSLITINGSTNLLLFKLRQSGESLPRKNLMISATQNQNKLTINQKPIPIEVKKFTSDNKMALRDFFKLMKSEEFPTFQVQLNYIETQPCSVNNLFFIGKANISLTITGVTKQYYITVAAHRVGDVYTISGKKKISIRDFGLTPPVEMMGLIKVSEWIEINSRLVCKISVHDTVQK